jgi:hypothetical protein
MPPTTSPWLIIPALLVFALMLYMAYRSVRADRIEREQRRHEREQKDLAIAATIAVSSKEAQERGVKLGLVLALFFLSERIEQMRKQALALTLPDGNEYGPFAREKAIIFEQIRIAGSCRDEIAVLVHGSKSGGAAIDESVIAGVKWPFTAANLQLSFAQKRLDSYYSVPTSTLATATTGASQAS